jgi:TRAP-type C4-dicarboxylate transport system permease small subunit
MVHVIEGVETSAPAASVGDAVGAERILAGINRAVVIASSVALVIASLVLTYSVASRYFLHLATDWQDELSVFLIVGSIFMSAAAVQARRGHVAIEAFVGLLSPPTNRVRQLLVDVASFAFCAFFSWKSGLLLAEAITDNFHSESTWAPPLWIPYSLMTAGMVLLSVQLLLQIVAQLRRRPAA